jgi:hypothetical protein
MRKFLLFILFLILAADVAHAKGPTRVQKINFEETDVDGKVRQPDGSYIVQKRGIEFIPLYKLKENFDEQIEESLQYIK